MNARRTIQGHEQHACVIAALGPELRGAVLRRASAEADVAHPYTWNLDAAIIDVSERAMDASLGTLFPDPPGAPH